MRFICLRITSAPTLDHAEIKGKAMSFSLHFLYLQMV